MVGSNLTSSTRSDLRNLPDSFGGRAARASLRNSSMGRNGWIRKIPLAAAGDVCAPAQLAQTSRAAREYPNEMSNLLRIVLLLLLSTPPRRPRCVPAWLHYVNRNLVLRH